MKWHNNGASTLQSNIKQQYLTIDKEAEDMSSSLTPALSAKVGREGCTHSLNKSGMLHQELHATAALQDKHWRWSCLLL